MRFEDPRRKLYVTAPIPTTAIRPLLRAQPPSQRGVRLTATDQMHVTLHYLGDAPVYATGEALRALSAEIVGLSVRGVGRFVGPDGTTTLWAGVEDEAAIARLHGQVAATLAPTGFRTEERPYVPHISLARCERGVPAAYVEAFLAAGASLHHPDVTIDAVSLCSMVFVAGVPRFTREATFPLRRIATSA